MGKGPESSDFGLEYNNVIGFNPESLKGISMDEYAEAVKKRFPSGDPVTGAGITKVC